MGVRDGDEFTGWYHRVHPRLVASVTAYCGKPDLARDAADEACLRVWQRWSRLRKSASVDGWAYRVACNIVKRRVRRAERERLVGTGDVVDSPDEGLLDVWRVLGELPFRQRQAIVLRHVADLPDAEIAAAMGIARGTVSATIHAAYARLRTLLELDEEGVRRWTGSTS